MSDSQLSCKISSWKFVCISGKMKKGKTYFGWKNSFEGCLYVQYGSCVSILSQKNVLPSERNQEA